MTLAMTMPTTKRLAPRPPLRFGIDRRYTWAEDGVHIVEVATGRVFHRDRWATRGR